LELPSSHLKSFEFYQSDFGYSGNESYNHYQTILPPASFWRSRTISFEEFEQPEWTTIESSSIPFTPENVTSIHFVPNIDPVTGGSSTLEVRNLKIF
jgi:hypothetical protein